MNSSTGIRRSIVVCLTALGAWWATACLPATAPQTPRPAAGTVAWQTPTALPARRSTPGVVLISLNGARGDLAEQFAATGAMPTFTRLIADGALVETLQPTEPPLGAPSLASLYSGATSRRTGVFADTYRPGTQALGAVASGYDSASAADPLWRAAMRTGARAAVIGLSPELLDAPTYRADWMVGTGAVLAPPAQHFLKFTEATEWRSAPFSFSPLREARIALAQGGSSAPAELFVLALDTTDDRQENYDAWLLSRSKTVGEGAARLQINQWAPVVVDEMLRATTEFKVMDANPSNFILYQSALMVNRATPLALARDVTARFGAPPAPPDRDGLARNWIDDLTYLQMAERQSMWLADVAAYVLRTRSPEVLVLRLGVAEDAARAFLLTSPRQPRFAERSVFYTSVLRRGYEIADTALARVRDATPTNSAFVVASAHGMAPAHSVIYANRLLTERGWLAVQRGAPDLAKSKALAEAGDAVAHIYLNLKGRDPGGIVEPGEAEKLQSEIIAALRDLRDPQDGAPVFARVLRKAELAAIGWQNEQAGDIVAQARAGFVISSARESTAVLAPVPAGALGAAGYAADLPELQGFLVAAGAGVRRGARLRTARAVDVAPTLAAILRINLPATAEGAALESLLASP